MFFAKYVANLETLIKYKRCTAQVKMITKVCLKDAS